MCNAVMKNRDKATTAGFPEGVPFRILNSRMHSLIGLVLLPQQNVCRLFVIKPCFAYGIDGNVAREMSVLSLC